MAIDPVLLDVHSYYSFGAGASSPELLVRRARALGYRALALTDDLAVAGAVALWQAATAVGIKPLIGATVPLAYEGERYPLVLIALGRSGYANLNALLSRAHASAVSDSDVRDSDVRDAEKQITLDELLEHAAELALLTGGRHGFPARLLAQRRLPPLQHLLRILRDAFDDRLYLQLFHDRYPNDGRRVRALRALAHELRLPAVAAPQVRYAEPGLYPLHDALVCARLGVTVDTPHPQRPRNDANYLLAPTELAARIPYPDALENAARLAEQAELDLLAGRLQPPAARLPAGLGPDEHLAAECHRLLLERYPAGELPRAREVLLRELHLLERYGFAEFFLVAAEIMAYCRSRGILAAGRGSAAGSVVCYLLGITRADPIRHQLLFERFLHTGMTRFPDVDIDIASSRRDEVLAWVERRFGADTEAMVCNRIRYRLPLALQDLGRALGLPPPLRNRLTRSLGRDFRHLPPHRARDAAAVFTEVLGEAPIKEVLLGLLESMEKGFVRHLAPHSGGVVLSRLPLTHYSPLQRSSGGIRLLQFDKDDVEALGLIKLDLLGLRMLGALERAREEVHRQEGRWLELYDLPDEPAVWDRIGEGDTLGLFQIESPSQMRISVQVRPRTLEQLAHQIALIRPGPIQSGTVHPYLRRHRGQEPVRYPHPALRPILERTYGVILFQEQVLRIARHVAGMSWSDADRFRKKASTFHAEARDDPAAAEAERREFIAGVRRTVGASEAEAEAIFAMVTAFQGYGFAESHAWAFALHAYASAWLRHHYPAEYLAAILDEHPGMWPLATLRQEARRWGVPLLRLDLDASGVSWRVERLEPPAAEEGLPVKALRPPLTIVRRVSTEIAREIVLERFAHGPYRSLRDLYERVALPRDVFEALLRAGAGDRFGPRRQLLFELEALYHARPAGQPALFGAAVSAPPLARLEMPERLAWEYALKRFSELPIHPLDLIRRQLRDLGAVPFATLPAATLPAATLPVAGAGGVRVRTAGLVVARQKPPTAKGYAFFVLEDGPLRAQLIISPDLWAAETQVLRDAPVLLVDGLLERAGSTLSLRAERLWGLPLQFSGQGQGQATGCHRYR